MEEHRSLVCACGRTLRWVVAWYSDPSYIVCQGCGRENETGRTRQTADNELARAFREGKGEIDPIVSQKIVLRELEKAGKLSSQEAMALKKRVEKREKTGFFKMTPERWFRAGKKADARQRMEEELLRQAPKEPTVTDQELVEAVKAVGLYGIGQERNDRSAATRPGNEPFRAAGR